MTTKQVAFTSDELLMDHDYAEPLVVNGVRCHGGFDESGTYVSPRTRFRAQAIEAWDEQRLEQFGTPRLEAPLATWPESFPNVEQTKYLLRQGVTEPTITSLTRIGTVEGFGSMMRYLPLPDLHHCFDDDITATATEHIPRGLFEAHARDEAGHEEEAGHNVMWFVARDIAFEDPVTKDETQEMLKRMGIIPPTGGMPDLDKLRAMAMANRVLPDDIPFELEGVLMRMVSLLFIEISAYHTFRWAEEVLRDTELVAGDGAAATLVSYIRQDEAPHVGYLQTALSEMRDRTWIGTSGKKYDGAEMIGQIWDRALEDSIGVRRQEFLKITLREIERALDGRTDRDDVLDEFFSLGNVARLPDGSLVDPTDRRAGGDHITEVAS